MSMRPWRRVVLAAIAGFVAGCRGPTPSSANRALAAQVAGSWDAELTLAHLPALVRESVGKPLMLRGRFAFVPSDAEYRGDRSSTAYGVYSVDFATLGVPRPRGSPEAVLYALPHDSLEIRLDPAYSETIIALRGRLTGDSIRGTWDVSVPRVTQGWGTFVMLRRLEP